MNSTLYQFINNYNCMHQFSPKDACESPEIEMETDAIGHSGYSGKSVTRTTITVDFTDMPMEEKVHLVNLLLEGMPTEKRAKIETEKVVNFE